MSYFIFQTLLRHVQDLHITDERLYQSILEMPFDGLVNAYNAFNKVLDVCLECPDVPELAFIVFDFVNLCAVEITDRLNRQRENRKYNHDLNSLLMHCEARRDIFWKKLQISVLNLINSDMRQMRERRAVRISCPYQSIPVFQVQEIFCRGFAMALSSLECWRELDGCSSAYFLLQIFKKCPNGLPQST